MQRLPHQIGMRTCDECNLVHDVGEFYGGYIRSWYVCLYCWENYERQSYWAGWCRYCQKYDNPVNVSDGYCRGCWSVWEEMQHVFHEMISMEKETKLEES